MEYSTLDKPRLEACRVMIFGKCGPWFLKWGEFVVKSTSVHDISYSSIVTSQYEDIEYDTDDAGRLFVKRLLACYNSVHGYFEGWTVPHALDQDNHRTRSYSRAQNSMCICLF